MLQFEENQSNHAFYWDTIYDFSGEIRTTKCLENISCLSAVVFFLTGRLLSILTKITFHSIHEWNRLFRQWKLLYSRMNVRYFVRKYTYIMLQMLSLLLASCTFYSTRIYALLLPRLFTQELKYDLYIFKYGPTLHAHNTHTDIHNILVNKLMGFSSDKHWWFITNLGTSQHLSQLLYVIYI